MWTFAASLALLACAGAITRDQFYPFGQGLDQRLPRNSEIPSPEITLKVPIVFYGEVYESIFVNNYGVLSFRADIPTFVSMELPLPYPSIAAFYINVDTTESGTVYYRETNEPHILAKAEELVQNNYHEYFDFKPTSLFIATWHDLTYTGRPDLKNTFQAAVISDGNETFVEFLYPEGGIQWIQKEPAQANMPEAKAQAGFSSEDSRSYILRGSGSHQIRNIQSWSNTHVPGRYVYRVGNIPPNGNIADPDQYDQYEVEVEEETKTCAQTGPSVCHMQAKCVDYQAGICCQCNEGFYGNGKSCVKDDVPLRVHGKLEGLINDLPLMNLDIQAYVVVADGRAYTALSLLPQSLVPSLQLLNVLGGVIGWLFAKPSGIAKNGYQLTGGLFNHTADILFPASGDRVTINQEFSGHDVFDQLSVDTDIRGTIPVVVSGTHFEISEYEEQYTLVESGLIRSESTRIFVNKNTRENIEQKVTQTITFSPCRFAPYSKESSVPLTLRVNKNYLGYENNQNIVRYGMSNKVTPLGQEDPCLKGKNTCGSHSTCVVQGAGFACVCQNGYTNIYLDNLLQCVDIDECAAGTHNCDVNADCYNHEGGFQCRCRHGYEGNGESCKHVASCQDKACDPNAQCIENYGQPSCVCNQGFTGDGQTCSPEQQSPQQNACEHCSPYASCRFDHINQIDRCYCNRGFIGDGLSCQEITTTPTPTPTQPDRTSSENYDPCDYCSPYAYCTFDSIINDNKCQCNEGYTGDGRICYLIINAMLPAEPRSTPTEPSYPVDVTPNQPTSEEDRYRLATCGLDGCECPPGYTGYRDENGIDLCVLDSYNYQTSDKPLENTDTSSIACDSDSECPPNAQCQISREDPFGRGQCVCPEGYDGDTFECIERTGTCNCGINAQCVTNAAGEAMCVCNVGFRGDGVSCRRRPYTCANSSDCELNAECRPDQRGDYSCQCVSGYIKDDSDACVIHGQFCNGATCAKNASCLYDVTDKIYYCACDSGYDGDGLIQCVDQRSACNIANDCHSNAVCTPAENTYECVCDDGYTGDGYHCAAESSCLHDPYLCGEHASCLKRSGEYVCECNSGYNGNGSNCVLNPRQIGNFLVASDGATVYKVPLKVSPREYATPISSSYQVAVGVTVDCETGKTYWGDVVGNTIMRAASDGSNFDLFMTGDMNSPEGLSIDWSARNIFWTDSQMLTIEVANLDTKIRTVLFSKNGIVNPRGIVVHPTRGKIFWSDWNRMSPKIEWANMDGTERGVFLDQSDVKLPNSLAIDWKKDRLCYADAGLSSIKCVSIESREIETIADGCPYPFGLAINGDTFYWTDWKTLKIQYIDTVRKQTGQVPVSTGSKRLYGVALSTEQCPPAENVCHYRNGNCKLGTICLPNGRGDRSCLSGTGR